MKTSQSLSIIGLFLLWLILPAALFATGVRTAELEDTQTRGFPKVELNRMFDPTLYDATTLAATDRNPIKSFAIKTNARLNKFLFRDATSNKVIQGLDGWLFIRESIATPCIPYENLERQVTSMKRLQDSLDRRGKTLLFTVLPNKATIYPEKLTDVAQNFAECTDHNRIALDAALRRSSVRYLNTFNLIADQKAMSAQPLYPPTETHWNQHGSAIFVEHLVDMLAPGISVNDKHVVSQEDSLPDLSRMSGLYEVILNDNVEFKRDGVWKTDREIVKNAASGRDFVHGTSEFKNMDYSTQKVLMIHDSFTYIMWDQIGQFFEDVFYIHWSALTPENFEEYTEAYDAIVISSVEREVYHRLQLFFEDDAEKSLVP